MPRSEGKSTAKVYSGTLYAETEAFSLNEIGRWQNWLSGHLTFYAELSQGTFTARRELRRGSWFWYAYRRSSGKLYKVYLGRSEDLTLQRLSEVADQLAVKIGL